jgi:hypothetical protein
MSPTIKNHHDSQLGISHIEAAAGIGAESVGGPQADNAPAGIFADQPIFEVLFADSPNILGGSNDIHQLDAGRLWRRRPDERGHFLSGSRRPGTIVDKSQEGHSQESAKDQAGQ